MRRRIFIQGIAASAAWPFAARAQQDRVRRIGALKDSNAGDPDAKADFAAFEDALQNLGWIVGRNVTIDYRWSGGDPERSRALAKELLKMPPDVIIAVGTAAVLALRNQTQTIPIVFARVSDPIGKGLALSLAKPGGNITGFSNFEIAMGGKWLETLKEIAPGVTHVAVIANPGTTTLDGFFSSAATASRALGIEAVKAPVHNLREMTSAMAEAADKPSGGVIVPADGWAIANRNAVIARANELRLPTIYAFRFFTTAGGLASYGIKTTEQFRGVASYVDRIFKGEKPGDLPVQAPTKFELVINLKTAKAIGLTIPPALLVRADEVIE